MSRAGPNRVKCIVRSNGVDREANRKEAKDKSLAQRTEPLAHRPKGDKLDIRLEVTGTVATQTKI